MVTERDARVRQLASELAHVTAAAHNRLLEDGAAVQLEHKLAIVAGDLTDAREPESAAEARIAELEAQLASERQRRQAACARAEELAVLLHRSSRADSPPAR